MKIDWQVVGDISTAIGVLVALAGVIVTLILTLRSEKLTRDGQRLEREQAEAGAARSEAAARLTEEYTRRVVEALETMAAGEAAPEVRATVGRVRWSLDQFRGDTFILTNVGQTLARDVRISAHESLHLINVERKDLAPDEAMTFMAAVSFGTRDTTITVRWIEGDTGEERTWRYPLPVR